MAARQCSPHRKAVPAFPTPTRIRHGRNHLEAEQRSPTVKPAHLRPFSGHTSNRDKLLVGTHYSAFRFGPRRFGFAKDLFLYACSRRTSVECDTESISLRPSSKRRNASGPSMQSGKRVASSVFTSFLLYCHHYMRFSVGTAARNAS